MSSWPVTGTVLLPMTLGVSPGEDAKCGKVPKAKCCEGDMSNDEQHWPVHELFCFEICLRSNSQNTQASPASREPLDLSFVGA